MPDLRVPKSMPPEHVVWAFRYGVAWARQTVLGDASAIRRHSLGYVAAPRNVLHLADRVRIEAIKRLRAKSAGPSERSQDERREAARALRDLGRQMDHEPSERGFRDA